MNQMSMIIQSPITIIPYDCCYDNIDNGMDIGFAIPNASNTNSNQHLVDYNYEIRLDEYILLGMEDISIANVNEDNIETGDVANFNIGNHKKGRSWYY